MPPTQLLPMHDVPIVFTLDDRFAKYTAVTMTSLLLHSKHRFAFLIISNDLCHDNIALLTAIARKFACSIAFEKAPLGDFDNWKTHDHFSEAVYYRLAINRYINEDLALYLDSDLVVTCDIAELLSEPLGDNWIGGCYDHNGAEHTRMPLDDKTNYINTGVLLLNLTRLRDINLEERSKAVYRQYADHITYVDQCILNKVAEGRIYPLDPRWNRQATAVPRKEIGAYFGEQRGKGILHFNGPIKPWMPWCNKIAADIWSSYAHLVGLPMATFRVEPRSIKDLNDWADEFRRQGDIERSSALKDRIIAKLSQTIRERDLPPK